MAYTAIPTRDVVTRDTSGDTCRHLTNATRTCRTRQAIAANESSYHGSRDQKRRYRAAHSRYRTGRDANMSSQTSRDAHRSNRDVRRCRYDEWYELDVGYGGLRLRSPRAADDLHSSSYRRREECLVHLTPLLI